MEELAKEEVAPDLNLELDLPLMVRPDPEVDSYGCH